MHLLRSHFRLILGATLLLGLFAVLSPELLARGLGQAPGGVPGATIAYEQSPVGAINAFTQIMLRLADGAAALAATVAIFFIVLNGARLSFSFGNTEALGKAKKGFIWASVGLVLIIFAYVITKSVVALTYSGADGSSTIGTSMINAPGTATIVPLPGQDNPGDLCRDSGLLPDACREQDFSGEEPAELVPLEVGTQTRVLQAGGEERSYTVYVPSQALPLSKSVPVLFVFHGSGGNSDGIAERTNFNALADSRGFIVVYPQALVDTTKGQPHWDVLGTSDLNFVAAIATDLNDLLGVHLGSIYTAGMSNGSVLAQAAACQIPAVQGVASVAAALGEAQLSFCTRTAQLPVIGFYGTADPFNEQVKFEAAFTHFATELNSCSDTLDETAVADTDPADGTNVDLLTPTGSCETAMDYYRITGGGHTWPSGVYPTPPAGGVVSQDVEASVLIADFFNLSLTDLDLTAPTTPGTPLAQCNQEAIAALAGVCDDLEVSPCTVESLETELRSRDLSSLIGCDDADEDYDSCTKRGIQELYRTQCIR